jgi:hypothetical protein
MSEEYLREVSITPHPVTFSPYTNNKILLAPGYSLSLVPKSIFYQFQDLWKTFYLFLSILELFSCDNDSPKYSNTILLSLLIIFCIIEDFLYTYIGKQQDEYQNATEYSVWTGNGFESIKSDKILVGQLVKVYELQQSPADLLVLCSSIKDGNFYSDFTEILGNFDINNQCAVYETQVLLHPDDTQGIVDKLSGRIKFMESNNNYNEFRGKLELDKHPKSIKIQKKKHAVQVY